MNLKKLIAAALLEAANKALNKGLAKVAKRLERKAPKEKED